jgi:hypothetical protein
MTLHPRTFGPLAVLLVGLSLQPAAAQSPLTTAKDSYAAADYDRCLSALDSAAPSPAEVVPAGEYRALCLVALNRDDAATKAVETIVQTEPLYQPASGASPRLKSLVLNVKRAVLPSILQERYAAAKKEFDARNYVQAQVGFRTVIALIDDPALSEEASASVGDLKTVARGFLDLMAAIPTATAPAAAPAPVSAARIVTSDEPGVTRPVTILQQLPAWRPDARFKTLGVGARSNLEIIIDETGAVEAATLLKSLSPEYDFQVVRAARSWKYTPASLNGKPVKYRKLIDIVLQQQN